jgi:hypothetical protein
MSAADDVLTILRTARGERPASLDCREAEEVLTVTLALLVELGVANDRIDRLERLVAEQAGRTVDEVREAPLGEDAETERREAQDALIARALRIFFDERKPTARAS